MKRPTGARQDRNLRRAIDYMREHVAERLTLPQVARIAGFAPNSTAPSRRQAPAPRPAPSPYPAGDPRPTKTARFLSLVTERHGPLAQVPLHRVAAISADLAPHAGLHPGSARAALRKAVLSARTGDPR